LEEQDEKIVKDDVNLRIGVQSFNIFVTGLAAEQGFKEHQELFDIPIALVHQSSEKEEHGAPGHVEFLWMSYPWFHELNHGGSLVDVLGEVSEALFYPFAFLFSCCERVGVVFLWETLLFDLVEDFDKVLCHSWRDHHREEYQ
jgi:hypothetical protein